MTRAHTRTLIIGPQFTSYTLLYYTVFLLLLSVCTTTAPLSLSSSTEPNRPRTFCCKRARSFTYKETLNMKKKKELLIFCTKLIGGWFSLSLAVNKNSGGERRVVDMQLISEQQPKPPTHNARATKSSGKGDSFSSSLQAKVNFRADCVWVCGWLIGRKDDARYRQNPLSFALLFNLSRFAIALCAGKEDIIPGQCR